MWTELKSDLFDDYGMDAGSHSLTLGRLYAWEKKLYEEVKVNYKSHWSCSTLKSKLPVRYLHKFIRRAYGFLIPVPYPLIYIAMKYQFYNAAGICLLL
jgi:hypothetical protein